MNEYSRLSTEFYDLDKPNPPRDEFAFFLKQAKATNGPVLEPMSGSGRFLIPMMEAGIDIDGFDLSQDMLAACRRKCEARGLRCTSQLAGFDSVEISRQYGLIFIPAGSLSLLVTERELELALSRMHSWLVPGGKLLIQLDRFVERASGSWPWGGRYVKRPNGELLVISWLGSYDAESRITKSLHRYEAIHDGQITETQVEEFVTKEHPTEEFLGRLRAAGFVNLQVLGGYSDRLAVETDSELVYVADKREK